jgi:hypothetical protein
MRQDWNRPLELRCVLAIVMLAGAATLVIAQAPGPPDGMEPPPDMRPPKMNVDKEMGKMAKRYALSDAQKLEIRPILEDERHKLDAVFQDSSLAPEKRFSKLRAIHEEQVSRISAVLSDNQRSKYLKDQEWMARDQEPGGPPPPPPGDEGGGPPPPQ